MALISYGQSALHIFPTKLRKDMYNIQGLNILKYMHTLTDRKQLKDVLIEILKRLKSTVHHTVQFPQRFHWHVN